MPKKKDPVNEFFKKIPDALREIAKGLFSVLELILNFAAKVIKAVFFFLVSFSFILLMLVLVTAVSLKLTFSALGVTESPKWMEYVDKKVEWVMQQEVRNDIERAFHKKSDDQRRHFRVYISDQTENHARGEIIFKGEEGNQEGGIFLAVKKYDKWEIVFEGNGAILCEEVEEYEFPEDMIEDCV